MRKPPTRPTENEMPVLTERRAQFRYTAGELLSRCAAASLTLLGC